MSAEAGRGGRGGSVSGSLQRADPGGMCAGRGLCRAAGGGAGPGGGGRPGRTAGRRAPGFGRERYERAGHQAVRGRGARWPPRRSAHRRGFPERPGSGGGRGERERGRHRGPRAGAHPPGTRPPPRPRRPHLGGPSRRRPGGLAGGRAGSGAHGPAAEPGAQLECARRGRHGAERGRRVPPSRSCPSRSRPGPGAPPRPRGRPAPAAPPGAPRPRGAASAGSPGTAAPRFLPPRGPSPLPARDPRPAPHTWRARGLGPGGG